MPANNSPNDEYGTGGAKVTLRTMTDIADDKGSYYLLKEGISTIVRETAITQNKDLILRAGARIRFEGTINPWFFTLNGGTCFKSFPLKSGDVTGFSDGSTNTIVTTSSAHNLNVNDVVRIFESRVTEYNGLFTISAVTTTTFTIEVTYNGADGQCRFNQRQLYVSTMAESSTSAEILTITLNGAGTGYENGETVTITGDDSSANNGDATVSISGELTDITISTPGTNYVVGDIVNLTGNTSGATGGSAVIETVDTGGEIITLSIISGGLGYENNETVTISAGSGTLATATVNVSGSITSLTLTTPGSSYDEGEAVSLVGQTSTASDATATVTVSVDLTTLTVTNHGLDDDISVGMSPVSGPPNPSNTGNFRISNVTTNTIDIERTFTATSTALLNVGISNLEFFKEAISIFPPFIEAKLFDLDSAPGPTSLIGRGCNFGGFDVGETRGVGSIAFQQGGAFRNCTGLNGVGPVAITYTDINANANTPPSTTSQHLPCIRTSPSGDRPNRVIIDRNSIGFLENMAFVEIPNTLDSGAGINTVNNSNPSPGNLYAPGYVVVANSTAITSENAAASIKIYVDNTTRFRVGDSIEILNSTSYTGDIGLIESIEYNASIVVGIAYVAGDTGITFIDTTLASKDGTDPQVTSLNNGGIPDSAVSVNGVLPYNAGITVDIIAVNTPVLVGGTYSATVLERMELTDDETPLPNRFTYTGVETRNVIVEVAATVQGPASAFIGVYIFKNGVNITTAPGLVDIANASIAVEGMTSQIVTVSTGDYFELAVSNETNATNVAVLRGKLNVNN